MWAMGENSETAKMAGKRIRQARDALGLTLKELSEKLGGQYSVTRMSNWEAGSRMISVEAAKDLAAALNVSAAYLLTVSDRIRDMDEADGELADKVIWLLEHPDEQSTDMLTYVVNAIYDKKRKGKKSA